MLKAWTASAHEVRPWPQPVVVLGQDDRVVGARYAQLVEWTGDAYPHQTTTLDHGALVKPDSWDGSQVVDYVARGLA